MSYSTARRRLNPVTARRRGQPVPTGVRRRVTSPVDGKTYSNPSNAAAGNYGYGSTTAIQQNFPSGYSSQSYGYTGGMAHKSTSKTQLIMAAAGAGVVGGLAAGYLYSRWSRDGWGWRYSNCNAYGHSWSGSCSECYRYYSRCQRTLPHNAARDDIMGTGFIPGDFKSPIVLTVFSLTGTEYDKSIICPPNDWNASTNTPAWTYPENDIFVTLTPMTELAEMLVSATPLQKSLSSLAVLLSFAAAALF